MPRDFFGKGKGSSPINEEIEKEAARELERLTGGSQPTPAFGPGMAGGGIGPGGGPGMGFGGSSPLEQMAAQVAERRTPSRRRRGAQRPTEDRAGFKAGGFIGAAANTGSVGSALGFGGGAAPGGRPKPPPPDALPLGYRPPEQYTRGPGADDDDDDDSDDDIGVTEMALRDHAERFGRGMEDMMIRSDPDAAENMREQALRKFMDRQAGPRPEAVARQAANLRMRSGARPAAIGRLRAPREEEPEPDDADTQVADEDDGAARNRLADGAAFSLPDDDDEAEEEVAQMPAAGSKPAPRRPMMDVSDDDRAGLAEERAHLAEERARVAEDRARVAEERARLAEERAAYAEARAWSSAKQASETIERFAELEALLDELMNQAPAPTDNSAPAPATEEPAEAKAKATPAPKAADKAEPAAKARVVKKVAAKKAAPKKAAAKKAAPEPVDEAPDDDDEPEDEAETAPPKAEAAPPEAPPGPRLGGVLGRRLAQAAQRVEKEGPPPVGSRTRAPQPAPASKSAPGPGPARVVKKAPGAIKRRPARS